MSPALVVTVTGCTKIPTMEGGSGGTDERRKKQYKVMHKVSVREARRQEVLKRQKEARTDRLDSIRELVLRSLNGTDANGDDAQQQPDGAFAEGGVDSTMQGGAMEEGTEATDGDTMEMEDADEDGQDTPHRGKGVRRRAPLSYRANVDATRYFTSQFSIPEWMVEVPLDLNGKGDFEQGRGWFVMARPEGKRCLLVATGGTTISRQQSGQKLHAFQSVLPHGGRGALRGRGRGGSQDAFSILDCVFHEPDQTYYMVDLLCWKGFQLQDCTAEFRLYFLRSKFEEEVEGCGVREVRQGVNDYRIVPLLYHDADPAGVQAAYEGPVPFLRDGLLFLNKPGYYEQGLSPLLLAWKDRQSSRYLLNDAEVTQAVVLSVVEVMGEGGCGLETLDNVVVGRVEQGEVARLGLRRGQCVRCRISKAAEEVQMSEAEGGPLLVPHVEGLVVEKVCARLADPWSKILFRSRALTGEGVGIADIARAAATHVTDLPTIMEPDDPAEGNMT